MSRLSSARLRHVLRVGVDALDPVRLVARGRWTPPPVNLLCVYRSRNAARVEALVEQVAATAGTSRLWALDESAPSLSAQTVGVGPGGRFALLNRLATGLEENRWLVIADDDVRLRRLSAFVAVAAGCGLDLAQPAHARHGSHYFHPIVGRQLFHVARQTTFVEIGPLFAVAPSAQERFLPFPEEGMGYGTELRWYEQHELGARLGIIDATPMQHLDPAAQNYDWEEEVARAQRMLANRGFSDWSDIQRTIRSLRPRRGVR